MREPNPAVRWAMMNTRRCSAFQHSRRSHPSQTLTAYALSLSLSPSLTLNAFSLSLFIFPSFRSSHSPQPRAHLRVMGSKVNPGKKQSGEREREGGEEGASHPSISDL